MSDDEAPKYAVELAMEKLRADGFEEKKLTDKQKAEIADIRSRCRAKIAEFEIRQEAKMRAVASMEELELLRAEVSQEKERLEREMETKVSAVREQES